MNTQLHVQAIHTHMYKHTTTRTGYTHRKGLKSCHHQANSHTYLYTHTYTQMHIFNNHKDLCTHTYAHKSTCRYTHTHTHTHTHTDIQMRTHSDAVLLAQI